jgi:CHAT domain-containing protein
LQGDLRASDLFIEYVLDDPVSYALAVTSSTIHRYELPAKAQIEKDATQYRTEIVKQKVDKSRGQKLFDELFGRIPEYKEKPDVVVVPDGKLHLLPYSALVDSGQYVLTSHITSVTPSGTVFDMLRHREKQAANSSLPYVGVAAWTSKAPQQNLLAMVTRAVAGPERAQLIALPESRREVEAIAGDLPKPSTILLGGEATETTFKQLPLDQYSVIHLALHAYSDPEFPDRSALVFAPQPSSVDDSLLQVREIRRLSLKATLVTLSACDTGVGPVSEEGVANIVNSFIEAGAQSVVATLWKLEDRATSQLMISFYGHLARGDGKAEALRKAQLEILNSENAPYFWAGFELDGDPSSALYVNTPSDTALRSSR